MKIKQKVFNAASIKGATIWFLWGGQEDFAKKIFRLWKMLKKIFRPEGPVKKIFRTMQQKGYIA